MDVPASKGVLDLCRRPATWLRLPLLYLPPPPPFDRRYVFASTLFFASIMSIQFFARSFTDLKLLWCAPRMRARSPLVFMHC
jgi:hypothetical protein